VAYAWHPWAGQLVRVHEVIERATGKPMNMGPYFAYLRGKYGELYSLPS